MKSASPCALCPHASSGFCAVVLGEPGEGITQDRPWQHHRVVDAGKLVIGRNQASSDVFVLCGGWGFRFLQLSDGRRQILGVLLPGDLFSVASLALNRSGFSVRALTVVQVSAMRREEVQSRLANSPVGLTVLANLSAVEREASDELSAVLGQCSAEERIAYLLLQLTRRIAAHNVIRDQQYPFPMRQQHIADATGLTAVHVSRVLGTLRKQGIADLSEGILRVLDIGELERLGSLR